MMRDWKNVHYIRPRDSWVQRLEFWLNRHSGLASWVSVSLLVLALVVLTSHQWLPTVKAVCS
jgi:hypothetical protein